MKVLALYSTIVAASFFALPVTTAMAQSGRLSQVCQGMYAKYQAAGSPKAFARSNTGGCGWKGPGGGISFNEARNRAMAFCVANGGKGCTIIASSR